MTIVDLFGHEQLRERLSASIRAGKLPSSLLLQGPRGVGKQRLAIWIAQSLLCRESDPPCGECVSCRYVADLTDPDLHWVFPRPRLKDSDPDLSQVRDDYAEGIAERAAENGLYPSPSGTEGIYVATVRYLVQQAVIAPAIGRRKVFIIGDAERMVPQEGADMAANAFLKLLEEPPADTTIILTSSEPGALLPTIRSRVVTVRVPFLHDKDVRAFSQRRASASAPPQVLPELSSRETRTPKPQSTRGEWSTPPSRRVHRRSTRPPWRKDRSVRAEALLTLSMRWSRYSASERAMPFTETMHRPLRLRAKLSTPCFRRRHGRRPTSVHNSLHRS